MTLAGRKSLEAMAERGDGQACLDLYEVCTRATDNLSARRWLEKALDVNYPSAQYVEGITLLKEGRKEEGVAYLKQACANGNYKAGYVLGQFHLGNIRNVEPTRIDALLGMQYLREAAIAGEAHAQVLLAKIFYTGKWCEKNPWLARWWMEKAAEQNDPVGVRLLDEMLLVRNALN